MAYKCKTCGYKFKKGDSDLCPECFTARDDIDCYSFEDHSHEKDVDDTFDGDDFIAQQLKDEKSMSREEATERAKSAYDNYRKNAYTKASTIKSDYNGGKSTLKFTTTYPSGQNTNTYRTYNSYNSGKNNKPKVKAKPAGCIITIIMILMFSTPVFSIVSKVFKYVYNSVENEYENDSDVNEYYNENLGFYADNIDGDITVYADAVSLGESYATLADAQESNPDISSSYGADEIYSEIRSWNVVYAYIYLDSYDEANIIRISLAGLDDDGEVLFSSTPKIDTDNYKPYYDHMPLLICEETDNYLLQVTVGEDNDSETINIKMTYEEIKENIELNESYFYNEYDSESTYEYDLSLYDTSVKDSDGKNVQLSWHSSAWYYSFTEDSLFDDDSLALIDDTIEYSTWNYAEFELTKADSSKTPLDCEYTSVVLSGCDPDNSVCYIYTSNNSNRLLLNEDVQLYSVQIGYIDELGREQSCTMFFTLDEFMES